jgi:hypothetical protein
MSVKKILSYNGTTNINFFIVKNYEANILPIFNGVNPAPGGTGGTGGTYNYTWSTNKSNGYAASTEQIAIPDCVNNNNYGCSGAYNGVIGSGCPSCAPYFLVSQNVGFCSSQNCICVNTGTINTSCSPTGNNNDYNCYQCYAGGTFMVYKFASWLTFTFSGTTANGTVPLQLYIYVKSFNRNNFVPVAYREGSLTYSCYLESGDCLQFRFVTDSNPNNTSNAGTIWVVQGINNPDTRS